MKCKACGAKNATGAHFCASCGSPLHGPFPKDVKDAKGTKGKKGLRIALAVLLAVAVGLIAVFVFPTGGSAGKIALGKTTGWGETVIGTDGGVLTVDDPSSPIDGLTLTVPENAYARDITYSIQTTPIKSHQLGELVHPITPLITIDNGHEFADEPMIVTIPIQKEDDEFAMAFFYDRATGELEGIPFLDIQNDSITIITAHFSDFFVSKEKKGRITEELAMTPAIDSGFMPGVDDFQMKNYGSIAAIGGHCAGQSIAAMYYYNNRNHANYSARLNGRYDNDEYDATPSFMWDDAQAMRLCSVVQDNYANKWMSGSWNMHQKESDVYYACAYTIATTKQPQFIDIRDASGGGHAIIVYKVTGDALYVADPNSPGDALRSIPYEITGGTGNLKSYFSGSDFTQATTNSTEYARFNYFGLYALFDRGAIAQAWYSVEQEEDPGAGLFPPDVAIMARVVTDADTGEYMDIPLVDGMAIADDQQIIVYPASGTFFADDSLEFYEGETYLNRMDGPGKGFRFGAMNLVKGGNDIGILYVRQVPVLRKGTYVQEDRFVNFYRFNIILQEKPQMSVSPESAIATIGDVIPFSASVENAPDNAVYTWDFGDGNVFTTTNTTYPYAYGAEGAYSGSVSVAAGANPELPLATVPFSVAVFEDEETPSTPVPTSNSPDGAQDTGVDIQGQWQEELNKTGGVGAPADLDSYLMDALYNNQPAYASYRIDGAGDEYAVGSAYGVFDIDTIEVWPDYYDSYENRYYTKITIERRNSQTGANLLLQGELSPDGNTINGTFQLHFDDSDTYVYLGEWICTRTK